MAATDILYEKRGAIALITLNRPEVLNAWRRGMVTLYLQHLDTAAKDDEVKAVILTGAGRAFSSGDDLKEEHSRLPATSTLKEAYGVLVELQEATRRMVGHPKIIICAMNGVAVGMGAELALASDLCIASDQASLIFTEVRRGLHVTNGVLYHLPRIVGLTRAMEWILTGRPVSAAELHAAGAAIRVVPGPSLLAAATELANTIAANAPISIRYGKKLLRRTFDCDLEAMLQYEVDAAVATFSSEDMAEGIRAFVEKRDPIYHDR